MQNWTVFINETNKKVYYKMEEGYKYITQYIEFIVDADFMAVFNVIAEVEYQ